MKLIREDRTVGWIVLVFALSQLVAVGWDLPGAYGWENDGIALATSLPGSQSI